MEQFTNIFSLPQLMNYESNVCDYARRLAKCNGLGTFEWLDADGFPFIYSDDIEETFVVDDLNNFYAEVELSKKVLFAIVNLMVSNSLAWRYHEQTNCNREMADKWSECYHSQRYYVMDSGKFTEDEVGLILKAID
ncbi:hypothetical protein Vca1114GL_04731 [Vibrio campbellii]|uniref:hypothetical protein n=1 Tax=Vibrio campbellii TaxID=680 RepID=UPI00097FB14F|nr:hypothetical protein [Vibrio campbellii]AQM71148.1 hypothetical protein Vca1114GL_04731 [Vibrio campbellii]